MGFSLLRMSASLMALSIAHIYVHIYIYIFPFFLPIGLFNLKEVKI